MRRSGGWWFVGTATTRLLMAFEHALEIVEPASELGVGGEELA
jgi:hypothetical protein